VSFDNPTHERSRALAAKDSQLRMTGRQRGCPPGDAAGLKDLLYSSLERIGTLVPQSHQASFFGIAVEVLPRGGFNAHACFPPQGPPYVLIDSGVVDFYGNLGALLTLLSDGGSDAAALSEQRVVDYIWCSALIYFSGEPDEGDTAILDPQTIGAAHAPKLHFSQLPRALYGTAFQLTVGAIVFLVCHEVAHILTKSEGPTDLAAFPFLEAVAEEHRADAIAFNLLISYAIRFPDLSKVRTLLRSVDFALICLELMQGAFPRAWMQSGERTDVVFVRESFDHPPAYARRCAYRVAVAARISRDDFSFDDRFDAIAAQYAKRIREGASPSVEFKHATLSSDAWTSFLGSIR
jgi:hypothetical protein